MYRPALHSAVAVLVLALLAATALASTERPLRRHQLPAPAPAAPPLEPLRPRPLRSQPLRLEPLRPQPPPRPPSYLILAVRHGRTVALRTSPGGRVLERIGAETEFGSPQRLAVAAERGPWVGVTTSERPNGALAWVDARSPALSERRTSMSLLVRLSRRLLELRDGRQVVKRIEIGVGRSASPTPRGRFAITDELSGTDYGSYYGCCILALNGRQANTPAGWDGGDRLAIHGTDDPSTIGAAGSAGCLHAGDADLRLLMRRAPVGTPVFIGG